MAILAVLSILPILPILSILLILFILFVLSLVLMLSTVIYVEQNYNPFLINFVKAPQPEVQASMDAH